MFKKWTFEILDCDIWGNELFETKKKAIEEGIKLAKELDKNGFFLGYTEKPVINISVYNILETIEMELFDDTGKVAEGWYQEILEEEKDKLEDMLNETFQKWMDETDNNINCYKDTNIEYKVI